MTIKEIEKALEEIENHKDDCEAPHILEDNLMLDFIWFISKRNDSIGKKAKLILTSADIEYDKFYI